MSLSTCIIADLRDQSGSSRHAWPWQRKAGLRASSMRKRKKLMAFCYGMQLHAQSAHAMGDVNVLQQLQESTHSRNVSGLKISRYALHARTLKQMLDVRHLPALRTTSTRFTAL
jgi:hypothetical protein